MSLDFFADATEIGMIYGMIALGVYLTLRVVDFPDMTVNSSFTLGAAVSTSMIMAGFHSVIATLTAVLSGAIAGWVTAFLNVKFKIQNLLSSIIVMIGLHSINLRIMGKPNVVIMGQDIIYTDLHAFALTFALVFIAALVFGMILVSEFGLGMRTSGQNALMGNAYGVRYEKTVYTVLMVSNGLVSCAGSLFTQLQEFCDIAMGNGVIVIGMASVMIGEMVLPKARVFFIGCACIIGAVLYNIIVALALRLSGTVLRASDVYIITAALIVLVILSSKRKGGYVN